MSWPNPRPDSMFLPKGRCRGSMCSTCPFQPDASGLGLDHVDFQPGGEVVQQILWGLPFYCHETVYSDRTEWGREGPDMSNGPQRHMVLCKGAVQFKRGEVELPTRALWACCAMCGEHHPPQDLDNMYLCPQCQAEMQSGEAKGGEG